MEGSVLPKGHLGMRKRRNEGWRNPNASLVETHLPPPCSPRSAQQHSHGLTCFLGVRAVAQLRVPCPGSLVFWQLSIMPRRPPRVPHGLATYGPRVKASQELPKDRSRFKFLGSISPPKHAQLGTAVPSREGQHMDVCPTSRRRLAVDWAPGKNRFGLQHFN